MASPKDSTSKLQLKARPKSTGTPQEQDPAKLTWINASLTVFAAGFLVMLGHWFSGRPGRCSGGNSNRGYPIEDSNDSSTDDRSKKPRSLAELRARRVEAAEARSSCISSGPSSTKLTPFGLILRLSHKVDKLEEEASFFLGNLDGCLMSSIQEKEQARLLELLTDLQLQIDNLKVDETIRQHKRVQTNRIQAIITALDSLQGSSTNHAGD